MWSWRWKISAIGCASNGKALTCTGTKKFTDEEVPQEAERIVKEFLPNRIPALREILATDVQAAYDSDPAAFNTDG